MIKLESSMVLTISLNGVMLIHCNLCLDKKTPFDVFPNFAQILRTLLLTSNELSKFSCLGIFSVPYSPNDDIKAAQKVEMVTLNVKGLLSLVQAFSLDTTI